MPNKCSVYYKKRGVLTPTRGLNYFVDTFKLVDLMYHATNGFWSVLDFALTCFNSITMEFSFLHREIIAMNESAMESRDYMGAFNIGLDV